MAGTESPTPDELLEAFKDHCPRCRKVLPCRCLHFDLTMASDILKSHYTKAIRDQLNQASILASRLQPSKRSR